MTTSRGRIYLKCGHVVEFDTELLEVKCRGESVSQIEWETPVGGGITQLLHVDVSEIAAVTAQGTTEAP